MHRHVPMPLLEAVVLANVVKIVAPDDYCPLHLHLLHHPGEDAAPDGHIPREGTLLIDVRAIDSLPNRNTRMNTPVTTLQPA